MSAFQEGVLRGPHARIQRKRIAVEEALAAAGVRDVVWSEDEKHTREGSQVTVTVRRRGLLEVRRGVSWRYFQEFAVRAPFEPRGEREEMVQAALDALERAYAVIHLQAVTWATLQTGLRREDGAVEFVEHRIVRRWFQRSGVVAALKLMLLGLVARLLEGHGDDHLGRGTLRARVVAPAHGSELAGERLGDAGKVAP